MRQKTIQILPVVVIQFLPAGMTDIDRFGNLLLKTIPAILRLPAPSHKLVGRESECIEFSLPNVELQSLYESYLYNKITTYTTEINIKLSGRLSSFQLNSARLIQIRAVDGYGTRGFRKFQRKCG